MVSMENFELNSPPDMVEEDKTEEELAALAASTPEAETPTPAEAESQGTVTLEIDPTDVSGSLNRLMGENPEVLNVVNAMIGQKAATKWRPQVSALELEISELRAKDQKRIIGEAPVDDVNERLRTDQQFRQQYDEVMQSDDVLAQQRQQIAVSNQINSSIELATSRGLSYERANALLGKVADGSFDVDGDGNAVSIDVAMEAFQSALYGELMDNASTPPVAAVESAPVSTEELLDTASPDVSPSGGGGAGGVQYTKQQIENMDPDEFIINFPNDGDYEQAYKEGRISGFSQEAKAVYS